MVDALATSLSYVDEICVDAGLLDQAGILDDLLGGACTALPFVLIAVTEQTKVLLGRKSSATGLRDGAFRMAKTGAALGVGACVAAGAGFWAAIPVTMGVRALFDQYRAKLLTGRRVQLRIQRLKELETLLVPPLAVQEQPKLADAPAALPASEYVNEG